MRMLFPVFRIVSNPHRRALHIADSLDALDRFDRLIRIDVDSHRRSAFDRSSQMDRIAGQQELAIRQVDQYRTFTGRMAGSEQELDCAVAKQIKITPSSIQS